MMPTTTSDNDNDIETFDAGYQCGAEAARAGMTSDLRILADSFREEIRGLRAEICQLAGLPIAALEPRRAGDKSQ